MINVTLRKNGLRLATLTATWHVHGNVAARILAGHYDEDAPDAKLGKRRAEKIIRSGLHDYGDMHWFYVHEDAVEEEWEAAFAWAAKQVRRHWPDWTIDEPS